MVNFKEWDGFEGRLWKEEINVRDFIQNNYTPYDGDESFLEGPTEATDKLWGKLQELQKEERAKGGVLDMDTDIVSSLTSHGLGYISEDLKDLEKIVGLQTDKPLKRAFMPYGGIKMAEESLKMYGYEPNPELHKIFTEYHKTHNQGVFDAYTPEMRAVRKNKIITGLPDTYGRGRIVGDYRRVALYGIDHLIAEKEADKAVCGSGSMKGEVIRLREELQEQINSLKGMKEMAAIYGYDISEPAKNAREAVQWTYFGYLAAIKTQNGAAMSIGRVCTFLDIYIERDLKNGTLTETEAQELIDHMTMKFRMVKFARIKSYNELFSGDPVWATIDLAGIGVDGRHMVTKTDYRVLHTLENMGPAPEPNITVLYSSDLPENFKRYAANISIKTSSVQYENDDVMKPVWGDDYAICCCVLYAINGGVDEKNKVQVGPKYQPITSEYLDYDEVMEKYDAMMDWLADIYVNTLNLIQYMHDKYYYEAAQMALIDTDVRRTFATGIAGFSHVIDSLSAIKYAKVKVIRLHLSLRSHQTWFMVRQPVLCQTAEKQDSHFHREQTQATVQSRMVCWLPSTLLQRFLMSGLWMVSPIHRPSIRTHLAMRKKSARQTLYRLWMVTSIREHITLMSMYLARRSLLTLWSIRRRKSMQTSRSVYPVTPLSLSI